MTIYALATAATGSVGVPGNFTGVGINLTFSVAPVSFEIRITLITYRLDGWTLTANGNGDVFCFPSLSRYVSGSASGGSSVTPIATRQGSAAASATCRAGNVSVSGTEQQFVSLPTISSEGTRDGTYEFPTDITVSPGSVFAFDSGCTVRSANAETISATMRVGIYFEELRLAWPY